MGNRQKVLDRELDEMLQATEVFSVEEITKIANGMYDSDDIPADLLQTIFIALPKKLDAVEYEMLEL